VAEVSGGIKKAVSARETAARAWRKVKQGGGKKRKSGSRKRSGSKAEGGAACLKETVNRKLKQNSGVLANLLLDKAREGDLPTIRYVVNLAEQHEAKEEVIDPGPLRSQALEWAAGRCDRSGVWSRGSLDSPPWQSRDGALSFW